MASHTLDSMFLEVQRHGFALFQISSETSAALVKTAECARRFFRTPSTEKLLNTLPEDCGYRPQGIEYSHSSKRPDPIESFTASPRMRLSNSGSPSTGAITLYEQMLAAIALIEPIVEAFAIRLAETLSGHPHEERLRGTFHRWSCMQANYSCPANIRGPLIHDLHEDGHLLTAGWSTSPGLEIQMKDGQVVPILWKQDELVIMPGEIAWLLSVGKIQPLHHRVRRDPCVKERISLLFFGDIDPFKCDPWIKSPINENVDIGARMVTNAQRFGLSGFADE